MNRVLTTAAALSLGATAATAGGIDRSGQFLGPLFEEGGETGSYVQFSLGSVSPTARSATLADPLESYTPWGAAFKGELNERLSYAIILDQPFGADVQYTTAPLAGLGATVESQAITTILRYKLDNGFSVHGGLRFQTVKGLIQTTRRLEAASDVGVGWLAGVAYERPEIALRVALTYSSKVKQSLSGVENFATPVTLTVETPDSINLEFQTGVAENTLVFGSIRHAFWDGFNVTTGTGTYVDFTEDTTTYSLGVGRKFNENWSGAITLGFEEPGSRPSNTALAPTTGQTTIGLGVTYTQGNTKVTGGISYGWLGDQTLPAAAGGTTFNDNTVLGVGLRVGFNF